MLALRRQYISARPRLDNVVPVKYSSELIERLRNRLQHPLPGYEAHIEMAPALRRKITKIPDNARLSAVLVLLYQHEGNLYIPLMRRTQDGRVHGGQVSLPGGKHDDTDPDFTFTALREAEEELNIPAQEVDLLGDLTDIYIPPSNFKVFPRLGFLPARPNFLPEVNEVADIYEVQVSDFLRKEILGTHKVEIIQGMHLEVPGYTVLDQHLVWGGTAMILAEFLAIFEEILD